MSAHLGRRAVLLSPLVLATAGCGVVRQAAGGSPAATTASPARTSSAAGPTVLSMAQVKDRMLEASGGRATARLSIRRAQTDSGRFGWTATGPVRYGPDGMGAALLDVDTGTSTLRVLVRQDAVFLDRAGSLRRIPFSPARTEDFGLLFEVVRNVPLVGQDLFVDEPFRRGAATAGGGELWTASVPRAGLSKVWPARQFERYTDEITSIDILVTLDAQGRPLRRVDSARPNSAQFTVETTWSNWGEPVTVPTP